MPIASLRPPYPKRWHQRRVSRRRFGSGSGGLWWRLAITLVLAGALVGVGVFAWVSRDLPTPEGIARRIIPLSTKIYDRTGKIVLYDIHGEEKRTAVELADIPEQLKQATITAEDRNFYEHKGFRFTSLVRAIIVNLLKGNRAQGGSTITQQFIKNAIFTNEKLYTRKIKELILAYQIERKFSKDEILKLYFNEIPYGSNAYGAEAAAQTFFGKSVRELNLAESAVLAALPKSTTYYSPWGTHRDELIGRQHYILDAMVTEGYINQAEAEAAKQAPLEFIPRRDSITAPHFVFYVRELLVERYGERQVEQGGLKIITTLDVEKQKLAEEAIASSEQKNSGFRAKNAALVALDVPTNQILSMVGSRDYFNDDIQGQVNVALRPRQPGSSFKPVVYSTAFAQGFTPETTLFDVQTTFKNQPTDYTPRNYDGKERGPVTLRQALAGSLNIPAVKLLYLTGLDNVLKTARNLGYTTFGDQSRFGLSLVLGGGEVRLLEHTSAYATFAREGIVKPTTAILKVEDARGNTLEEYRDEPGDRVFEPQPVRLLTSVLSDNEARSFIFGGRNSLTLPDRPVAAKTGTTNDFKDAWTVGYTPQLAVGVWVGNSDGEEMRSGADGSVVAAPIWQNFFSRAVAGTPVEAFAAPVDATVDKPILRGEIGDVVVIDSSSGKRATEATPEHLRSPRLFKQYHTILRYVTPGDPLGPPPTQPENDPQYANWEAAVRRWVESRGLSDEQPPSEYDDIHTEANRPQIVFVSPLANQTVTQNPIPIQVNANSTRRLAEVRYFLDGVEIGRTSSAPFSLAFSVTSEWPNGYHTLRAVIYDDVGNSNSTNLTFNLLVTPLPSTSPVSFIQPTVGERLDQTSFPYTVTVTTPTPGLVRQIDLYVAREGEPSTWLGVVTSPEEQATFIWPKPNPGRYTLSLTLTTTSGVIAGPRLRVSVSD